jgi:hypothetical protein
MDTKPDKIKLKWYHIRRLKLTGEYCGGLLAGFGMGIVTMASIIGSHFVTLVIPGFLLISIGGFMALHAQGRYIQDQE